MSLVQDITFALDNLYSVGCDDICNIRISGNLWDKD